MKKSNKLKWIRVTAGYIAVIFILSFRHPGVYKHTLLREVLTNLAHIPLYGVLGYFTVVTIKNLRVQRWATLYTLCIGVAVGCIDEFFQSFVPGRNVDILDIVLDSIGIITGIVLFRASRLKAIKNKS